ncbi:MAG: methyltransferase domain-containing protein [Chthoniobacterales bacterium]|nr:methyltransferase domain-containing protein [Chthoniobacterales bacterium]
MKNGNAPLPEHERACARVAARFGELWLRLYAGRKLRSDPVFPAAFALLRDSPEPLIDVGCGVGLLSFYLRERNLQAPIVGLDRDGRKIARAQAVARAGYRALEFLQQDACEPLEQSGNLVLFDVLHYLRPNEQARLLARLVPRVARGGMLIIRDCPCDGNLRFWLTLLAERFAQLIAWNVRAPLHFPTREKICSSFPPDEFSRAIEPLWGRTPFNNHLFIFRRRADATVPAPEARNDNPPARVSSA